MRRWIKHAILSCCAIILRNINKILVVSYSSHCVDVVLGIIIININKKIIKYYYIIIIMLVPSLTSSKHNTMAK